MDTLLEAHVLDRRKMSQVGGQASAELIQRPPWDTFNWPAMSYLLQELGAFFIRHCSWEWLDQCRFEILDRPDCQPHWKGTVREKMIVLFWEADDLCKPPGKRRSRTRKWPLRDHEAILRSCFCEHNLDVDMNWGQWTVRISLPEFLDDSQHVFRDKREPPLLASPFPTQVETPSEEEWEE